MKVWSTFLLQLVSQFCFCLRRCIKIVRLFLAAVSINGLTHWHSERPKQAWLFCWYFPHKSVLSKIFEGEMFIRILPTTLLQIFCENLLNFQGFFKSMKIADDTFLGNSECEWVKDELVISSVGGGGGGSLWARYFCIQELVWPLTNRVMYTHYGTSMS